jgi:3'-phosphoadenosine 5'-phosphosulfate sulfotransferase (PAPS reductase)/FAD synthetase
MIAITEEIKAALARGRNTCVAVSISGGKDSSSVAMETVDYLRSINFAGEIILIHSDLGLIEHSQSIQICRRLSARLNVPLVIVHPLREMIERWVYRWQRVVERFTNLETVRISTPFSSAQNRFCTSEEKTVPICRYLKHAYPGKTILNVVGIRRDESKKRASKPIAENNTLLAVKTKGTSGITWLPIADYKIEDIFLSHRRFNFPFHEAYTTYGMSRVSCSFCVLAGETDLQASLTDVRNHEAFRQIARLEIASTFSFKPDLFLADLAPELLSENERQALKTAKAQVIDRCWADRLIPTELLFDKDSGFPSFQPSLQQATALGEARAKLGATLNIPVNYTTGREVYDRYAELLIIKHGKEEEKRLKAERKRLRDEKKSGISVLAIPVNQPRQLALFS